MKRNLLFNSVCVLSFLLCGNKTFSQDASMGYDYVGAANYPTAWSSSPIKFNVGTSKEVVFTNDGTAANIKSATVAGTNNVTHYELGGAAPYIEVNLTLANSSNSSFTVEFTGSSNSTTLNTAKGGVVYSDKMPFDEASVIGAEETAFFPASNGTFNKIKINPPSGTKSLRMYRRVYFGSGSMSSSSGSGRVQYGLSQTIRLASITVYQSPITQASNITFTSVTNNSMTVNWTNGSGSSRTVFIKENGGVIANPVDGTTYTASTDWSVKGNQLGTSGYYCVYNGSATSVDLTNLNLSNSYTVQIFDYNGSGTGSKFQTAVATDNPKIQAAVLPISLTSFKANTQSDGISLNWVTSYESNANKFVVERKTANSDFVNIAEIKAKGKGSNYVAKDANVLNGETYYYRLKMVDNDGTFKYSNLSSATFSLKGADVSSIYPNPATNAVTITYPEANSNGSLYIIDSKGSVVITSAISANSTQQNLDVSSLKTGVYVVKIVTGSSRVTLKLIKN